MFASLCTVSRSTVGPLLPNSGILDRIDSACQGGMRKFERNLSFGVLYVLLSKMLHLAGIVT